MSSRLDTYSNSNVSTFEVPPETLVWDGNCGVVRPHTGLHLDFHRSAEDGMSYASSEL